MPFNLPSRYQPKTTIGAGGMGVVQLYRDTSLDRDVAVKFTQRLDNINRVYDELRALQQLRSNHVVQLYDVIRKSHKSFEIALVEEFLPGEDLEVADPMSGQEYLLTLWQIASGLADVHEIGLIHRDIKPDNLKFAADRHIKLFDFGLTRPTGARARTVGFVGTDIYAAPELYATGEVAFDRKVDVYAFGVSAWRLTGSKFPGCLMRRPPVFDRTTIDFIVADPMLPLDVALVLQNCLQSDPADRPEVSAVRDMLARHVLKNRHRALAVTAGQEHRLDASHRAVRIRVASGDSVDIRYDGLDFSLTAVSGVVYVNNMPAATGLILPGCCVIALGTMDKPTDRVYITFDISQPEISI
jgi:eukaryotic-like serine/threonine-protein kinase